MLERWILSSYSLVSPMYDTREFSLPTVHHSTRRFSLTGTRFNRYYKDTHKILGQTFNMLILQDFEAITPNLLARTIETVEGGGIVVCLLQGMKSLRDLYGMTMVRISSHALCSFSNITHAPSASYRMSTLDTDHPSQPTSPPSPASTNDSSSPSVPTHRAS